jgi:hypothetical protein
MCEAKPRVGSDWLLSSSKLQPCLELCQFARRFLRQKLQDGKRISFSEYVKSPICNIHRNGWRITRGCNRREECHTWSLVDTTSRILALKLTTSLRLMIRRLFLIVSKPCLTFLSSVAYRSPQPSVLLGSNLSSSHVGPLSSKYPTWCQSTSEPCRHDLTHAFMYLSCSIIQENVIFNHTEDRFSLEILTSMKDVILDFVT